MNGRHSKGKINREAKVGERIVSIKLNCEEQKLCVSVVDL